jgi:hypothetical protein
VALVPTTLAPRMRGVSLLFRFLEHVGDVSRVFGCRFPSSSEWKERVGEQVCCASSARCALSGGSGLEARLLGALGALGLLGWLAGIVVH